MTKFSDDGHLAQVLPFAKKKREERQRESVFHLLRRKHTHTRYVCTRPNVHGYLCFGLSLAQIVFVQRALSLMTSSTSSSSSSRGARLQTFARVDGGVGVFGNKAGMTQIFTDDGLCVPVTVIAVKDGNYVSACVFPWFEILSLFPRGRDGGGGVDFWIAVAVACEED